MNAMTFRMYASVKFNREINWGKDLISIGGYRMVMDDKVITFDFEESTSSSDKADPTIVQFEMRNPDYDTFKDLAEVTLNMLRNVTEVKEFNLETDNDNLKPVSIESLAFVSPYDEWEPIEVSKDVLDKASL